MTAAALFEGHTREVDTTSSHHIEWTFDRGYITGKVLCVSGPDANCRLYSTVCACESWHIERDDTGAPYHLAWDENVTGEEVEVRHYMKAGDDCNVKDWLDQGDLEESVVEQTTFTIARTPIEPEWEGDHYLWAPAAPAEAVTE